MCVTGVVQDVLIYAKWCGIYMGQRIISMIVCSNFNIITKTMVIENRWTILVFNKAQENIYKQWTKQKKEVTKKNIVWTFKRLTRILWKICFFFLENIVENELEKVVCMKILFRSIGTFNCQIDRVNIFWAFFLLGWCALE